MAETDSIHLYAELLLNIKSVTFIANINSASTSDTEAILITDGPTVSLTHLNQTAFIKLPVKTIGNASATLSLPAHCPKQLSSRLQVDGGNVADLLTLQDQSGNEVPWSASALSASTSVSCRFCETTLVNTGSISKWADLPSEDWAEMSDFWYCHRPHNSHENGSSRSKDESSFIPRVAPGVSLVDGTSFLFDAVDCKCLKEQRTQNDEHCSALFCGNDKCSRAIGMHDEHHGGLRVWKSCVSLDLADDGEKSCFPVEKWISASLLTASDRSGLRKFIITLNKTDDARSALIWIFASDLWFCSSKSMECQDIGATRAMKILWKAVSKPELAELREDASVEDLDLIKLDAEALFACLESNHMLLPTSAEHHQDWTVSLLRRFSAEDLAAVAPHVP